MIKNKIFHTDKYKEIEEKVKELLNSQEDFLSSKTAQSTRAVGSLK